MVSAIDSAILSFWRSLNTFWKFYEFSFLAGGGYDTIIEDISVQGQLITFTFHRRISISCMLAGVFSYCPMFVVMVTLFYHAYQNYPTRVEEVIFLICGQEDHVIPSTFHSCLPTNPTRIEEDDWYLLEIRPTESKLYLTTCSYPQIKLKLVTVSESFPKHGECAANMHCCCPQL